MNSPCYGQVRNRWTPRMLNVALRVSSDAFTGQLERIAHNAREEEDKRLFDQFDAALKEHNIGSILLAVEKAKNQATMVIEGAVATAILWEHDHPCEELKAIVAGRKRQLGELNTFFVAISRGVTTGASAQAADKSNTYIVGAWAGFFEGLRAGRYSSTHTASTLKRGRKHAGSDKEHSSSIDDSRRALSDGDGGFDSDARPKQRRKNTKDRNGKERKKETKSGSGGGSSMRAGSAGGASSSTVSGARCRRGVHFPCSVSIIGPKLGAKCSAAGPCKFCKKTGHWSGECPVGWADDGHTLPGYSVNGLRFKEDWDAQKNPRKVCAKAWVKFLKNKSRFPSGGSAALEPRAPALSDFEKWVGSAQ